MVEDKTIAIIGVGAIGSKTALLISKTKAKLIIVDRDIVESKNLSYQKLYTKKDVGKPKAIIAAKKLSGQAITKDLTFENVDLLDKADLILDCTDNLETRFLINDYCLKNKKPWIYAAGIKNLGTTINFLPNKVCFRCIFNESIGDASCETAGITDEVIEKVSKRQVENAIKILQGEEVSKDMVRFSNTETKLKIHKRDGCKACRGDYEYLNGKRKTTAVKLCGSKIYQIKGSKRKSFEKVNDQISVFPDGRALIKAKSEKEARTLYSRYIGN